MKIHLCCTAVAGKVAASSVRISLSGSYPLAVCLAFKGQQLRDVGRLERGLRLLEDLRGRSRASHAQMSPRNVSRFPSLTVALLLRLSVFLLLFFARLNAKRFAVVH